MKVAVLPKISRLRGLFGEQGSHMATTNLRRDETLEGLRLREGYCLWLASAEQLGLAASRADVLRNADRFPEFGFIRAASEVPTSD